MSTDNDLLIYGKENIVIPKKNPTTLKIFIKWIKLPVINPSFMLKLIKLTFVNA